RNDEILTRWNLEKILTNRVRGIDSNPDNRNSIRKEVLHLIKFVKKTVAIPQVILNGEWKMAIGGVPVSAEWSESGTGQADYQITAVYSDAETEPYLKKHVYLFGFQQNQPKVLVTQQNQGNPDNYLYFNETANNELKNGFNQIVYG
ncbi:DUF4767 domain-containing protein, partial [Enterococcus faecium]|nr:DUF4767 domain-containing protein [Enterococcus faecium]